MDRLLQREREILLLQIYLSKVVHRVGNVEGITTLLGEGADHDKNLGNVLGAGAARRDGFVRQHQLKIECTMINKRSEKMLICN